MIGNWYEADDAESNAKSSCTKVATGIAVVKKNKGDNKFYLAIAKEKVFEKFKKYFN